MPCVSAMLTTVASSDTNQIIKWHDFLNNNPPVTHKYKYVHTYLECIIL